MRLLLFAICMVASTFLFSQNTNIQQPTSVNTDGAAPDASAQLDVQATDKGMLLPRMTTAQRTAIATPSNSLLVYDTETKSYWFYDNGIWNEIATTMAVPAATGNNMPNIAIPDNTPPPGILDTISLTQSGVIEANTRIKVCVNITHRFTGALDISLIGPDLTTIDLSSNNGSGGANYTNACFSTGANNSITTGSAPFTGSWMPEQPFSNFLGKPITGLWVLKVIDDDAFGDNGTFNSWSLEIAPKSAAASLLSDKNGDTKVQVEKTPNDDRIRFDVAGTQAMMIDSSGKVGIGTDGPASHLHVFRGAAGLGPNSSAIASLENNGNGYLNLLTPDNAESGILFGNPGDGAAAGGIIYNSPALRNGLQFRTDGNTTRMVLDSLGNVGIGYDPSAPLSIKATSSTLPSDNGLYLFNDTNAAGQNAIISARVAGSTGGDPYLSFDVANESGWSLGIDNSDENKLKFSSQWANLSAATKMTIQTNGKVGIGTNNPKFDFHISNDATSGLNIGSGNGAVITSAGTPRLYFEHTAAPADQKVMFQDYTNGKFRLNSTNDAGTAFVNENILVAEWDGNVGIGLNDPTEKLHVNGNIRVANDASIFGLDQIVGFNDLRFSGDATGGADFLISGNGQAGFNSLIPNVSLNVQGITGDDWYFSVESPSQNPLFDVLSNGNVAVTNNLSKGGGSFKIDHPLDPENQYLYHSFVESPDMMNIYNGNVTTDGSGIAEVELPEYFTILNKDFRYQLTVIGTFAQAIIKEEVANNQFVIQTSEPNVKVSWQLTGIRQDPYANQNRIEVEVEKPAEKRGTYLHPAAYHQPESKSERRLEKE